MSRRLVNGRSRQSGSSTPAQRRHARDRDEIIELPPYEQPICALSAKAKRALEQLNREIDFSKYDEQIKKSKALLSEASGECNDRNIVRQKVQKKNAHKREKEEKEKTNEDENDEIFARHINKKTETFTKNAEKAMRDLIDYSDERAMHESLLEDILQQLPDVPVGGQQRRRARNDDSEEENGDDDNDEEEEEAAEAISAIELLQKARSDYTAKYQSKTMLKRYEVNDYKNFKRVVHDAKYPGEDAPPLEKASRWFPQDKNAGGANNTLNSEDEEDDDLVISGGTTNLKCPLSLQQFSEPYSSDICTHTFEKSAIIEYINSGTVYAGGEKQKGCPVFGCDKQLRLSHFRDDNVMLRKVKRALQQELEEEESVDEDEDEAPQSSRRRPVDLSDDEDGEEEDARERAARIKRERQSRGPSAVPRRRAEQEDAMDEDED